MQVAPSNPVLQALSGAQETGAVRQQRASTRVDTASAVQAPEQSDARLPNHLPEHHDTEAETQARPKRRGSLVDIKV